jgi:Ca2+-transporting ATPase
MGKVLHAEGLQFFLEPPAMNIVREETMKDKQWHALDIQEVCRELETGVTRGIGTGEATGRLKKYGGNSLRGQPPRSLWSMFLGQMREALVIILLAAAVVSGILGEWEDTLVILVIVVFNAVIGVFQENKAENALRALKAMTKPLAKAVRDGHVVQIKAEELVPGDVVLLDAGDSVPADLRLVEAASLRADESALTGESVPVEKRPGAINDPEAPIGDRTNMAFMGTAITGGRGRGIVVETGMGTQIGRIAQLLAGADVETTPLQKRLNRLGKTLGIAAGAIVLLVFLIGLGRGQSLQEMFMVSISLAVAAVPEGLPAVVTVVLALGVTRMSRRNAIIRRLPAVETLGTATVICSDKTGTLTKNEMTVTQLYVPDRTVRVTGTGYDPTGGFLEETENRLDPLADQALKLLLLGGLLNSDAGLEETDTGFRVIGDPTEGALLVAAVKAGLAEEAEKKSFPRLAEIPFDSDRKMMTTFHRAGEAVISYTKGAPDVLISRCTGIMHAGEAATLTGEARSRLLEVNSRFASQGQRVLALATRQWAGLPGDITAEAAEKDLTFAGFFAMQDPPRPEAGRAVALCRRAGIRVVMITGDHQETAAAIAGQLGIMAEGDQALTGGQLEKMGEEELRSKVHHVSVYARVSPEHKLRIVDALKHHGHVVAMTGDGVNDAPALKRADIGAAMGITGTEVAKEASDMVLQDDNFATIVSAVEQGRTIYNNIRGSVQYLLSCNTGEIAAIFIALALGLGSPLTPIQILWLNLVTDGPPALALGLEPPQRDIMNRPPRKPGEGLFSGGVGAAILWQGALIGLMALGAYWLALSWGRTLEEARTMAFITLAMSQLIHSFNTRSLDRSIFSLGVFSNRSLVLAFLVSAAALLAVVLTPFLREAFDTADLRRSDWVVVLGLSIVPLFMVELSKLAGRLKAPRP